MKSNETIITFPISGKAFINDWIAILKPGFLEIILRGLNTLSILNILKMPSYMSSKIIETTETVTMMKSIMFQGFFIYEVSPFIKKPNTITLVTSSIVNRMVTMKSIWFITCFFSPSGFSRGFSMQSIIVEKRIKYRMRLSKLGWQMTDLQMFLNLFSVPNR